MPLGPELPKPRQNHLLMVSLVLSIRLLRNIPRTLGSKSRMVRMKILFMLYPIPVILSRLTPSSPPRQIKPQKGKIREKERIKLINRSRIQPNLHPRREPQKPKYPFLICDEDHYTKDYPRWSEVSRLLKGAPGTPAVLKEPFPSQQTQTVADPSQSSSPFGSQVFMAGKIPIHISTRAKEYPSPAGKEPEVPSSAPPSSSGLLHIERPSTETPVRPPPKGVLRKCSYKPNAHAAQHYSIFEDLS